MSIMPFLISLTCTDTMQPNSVELLELFPLSLFRHHCRERKADLREEQGHVLACISWSTCCAKLNVTVVEIDSACPHVTRILHAITDQYVNNSRTLALLEKLNQILPSWFNSSYKSSKLLGHKMVTV
jgi:hypothetical protein